MELTEQNYYTLESDKVFSSYSQFKNFFSPIYGCEKRALAELNGEYERPQSSAMLLGQYVDTMLTETDKTEDFKKEHPKMFSTRGTTAGMLKVEYQRGNQMVERVKRDAKFMKYIDGEHQRIMTGVIAGVPFKIKMDTYVEGKKIVDLKTVESIRKRYWHPEIGYTDFIHYNDYILQLAIYQEVVLQNTGEKLPCYIAAISKEPTTDYDVIHIPNEELEIRLFGNEFCKGISDEVELMRLLKSGEVEPTPCGKCDFCLENKVIERPISLSELAGSIE